jgi:hypothetical protein
MPAEQQGQVYKTTNGYGLRWYDETGTRRRKAGFKSRSEARAWFRDVELKRMRGEAAPVPPTTLLEHVDRYLDAQAVGRDPKTIDVLRFRLGYATRVFGDLRLDELERRVPELAAWTTTLPAGSRYGIVAALRQCLEAAVRWGLIGSNPAEGDGAEPAAEAGRGRALRARRSRASRRRARPDLRAARRRCRLYGAATVGVDRARVARRRPPRRHPPRRPCLLLRPPKDAEDSGQPSARPGARPRCGRTRRAP